MLDSGTDLLIFDAGSVNGTRYCNEILLPYVRLFRGAMGLQFLFMDDNAPCHHTVAAEQLLESEDMDRMDWPARSPDLNPIEHVWDFLGRRLAARTLPPVTIRELRLALQDEWQQCINNSLTPSFSAWADAVKPAQQSGEIISPTKDRMFRFWTPITGMFRPSLEVSEELGIAQSVISRLWQRFQDDGNVSRCYSTSCPRITTPNEDRYLAVTAKRNIQSTASDLSRQLFSATSTTVSRQTVYRRLGHIGLYARRPVRYVPLTATHCCLRLTWSREHALRTPQQWSCVMFSDESRFSLQSDSRRNLIRRVPGTCYHQENTIEHVQDGLFGEELFLVPELTCMFRV
ncbi:HTH_Tnp_Tc3_2 domain-containing protein [Trichonephila clavipes]|nr:HTH_Tnp_Tc3_2 domain-containing protein [Trichonephila clavipes]